MLHLNHSVYALTNDRMASKKRKKYFLESYFRKRSIQDEEMAEFSDSDASNFEPAAYSNELSCNLTSEFAIISTPSRPENANITGNVVTSR